jgi:phage FluMu protein Com
MSKEKSDYISSIEEKLKRFEQRKSKRQIDPRIWKPKEASHTIRLVPYYDWPDPFMELYFHYEMGESILCPAKTIYIDQPCPICEYVNQLYKTDYKAAGLIRAKLRAHVPIIERGKEFDSEGKPNVKLWGISDTVYKSFLTTCHENDEEGKIWDPTDGADVIVTYTKPDNTDDNRYGNTSISVKRKESVLIKNANNLNKILENVPKWDEVFKLHSHEELEKLLDAWINKMAEKESKKTSEESNESSDSDLDLEDESVNDTKEESNNEDDSDEITKLEEKLNKLLKEKK